MKDALLHALDPAGPQAAHIAHLWWWVVGLCAVVFVTVLAALLVALRRAPRGSEATPADVRPLHHGEPRPRRAIIAAVAASVTGLFAILLGSVATDRALARMPVENALGITITAHQWWWDVHYDDPDSTKMFSTANEIHVPVGRPVLLRLNSDDVIHSFWVPNLHGKKDLIPGKTTTFSLQADRPGTYRGQCAEFCGAQHAFMAFFVVAEPPEAFAQWAEKQRAPSAEPTDAQARQGRELFLSGSCMMCHAIAGTSANARKAPDLTHVASRATLAAGRLPNDAASLAAWIRDPQRAKPGTNMPAHNLPDEQLQALVAYLRSLQ